MDKIKQLERIHKNYASLLSGIKNHNIVHSESAAREIVNLEEGFWEAILTSLDDVQLEIDAIKSRYSNNREYASIIYERLTVKDIPASLDDTVITIGPMEITCCVEDFHLQVTIGRKKQRITELEPGIVVKKIDQIYRKLNSSFNANFFFKKVLKAYDLINTRMYSSRETKYGFSVALKDIFDLFALSPSSSYYKIENFIWDIGRLLSTGDTFYGYRVELGFSRDVKKMYLIKTTTGQELKASTITIHERMNDDENLE